MRDAKGTKPHESCRWDRRQKAWICDDAALDKVAGKGKRRGVLKKPSRALEGLESGGVDVGATADPAILVIEEKATGSKNRMEFVATINEMAVGRISAAKSKVKGRVVYAITGVSVVRGQRRRGIATALYERAAMEACRRRGRIASVERITGAFSNEFWEKQAKKGRAEVHKVRAYSDPVFVLKECPPPRSLRGRKK